MCRNRVSLNSSVCRSPHCSKWNASPNEDSSPLRPLFVVEGRLEESGTSHAPTRSERIHTARHTGWGLLVLTGKGIFPFHDVAPKEQLPRSKIIVGTSSVCAILLGPRVRPTSAHHKTSASMTSDAPESSRQIIDALSDGLSAAFQEVCPKRYGGPLTLQRTDSSSNGREVWYAIESPNAGPLQLRMTVNHVGGNVYDITTQVEDAPPRRFTCSKPDGGSSAQMLSSRVGENIANHVLDRVEQRLGRRLLSKGKIAERA